MTLYTNNINDQYGRPLDGAIVEVWNVGFTALASITDAGGSPVATSRVETDADGAFTFGATDGIYSLIIYYGGRERFRENAIQVGAGVPLPSSILFDLAADTGAALVGFSQSSSYAAGTVGARLKNTVSVKDKPFNAKGDGTTDDKAAIQAAFNSGAKRVTLPPGTYVVSGGLTVPNWLHIQGEGYQPTIGVGGGAVVLKFTQTSGVAMSLGYNPLIERIVLWNSGGSYNDTTKTLSGTTAVGMDLASDNATLKEVAFHLWDTCIRFGASSFYVKTEGVEFNRCTNGYRVNGTAPYNVHISAPISRDTTHFFTGHTAFPARNIKVFGGSIEGYQTAVSGVLDYASFGTYYETISQRPNAYGIDPGVNGASVGLFGNTIYLNNTSRFVNLSGLTNTSLTGSGNQFEGAGASGTIFYYLPSTGSVALSGDLFGTGHNNATLYVDSIANAAKFNGVTIPVLPSGNTQAGYSGMQIIGSRGYISVGLTAEPTSKTTGMTVMADGTSWDPLTRAAGRPYWVIWQGDRWRAVDGGS